mgnify:FL=1
MASLQDILNNYARSESEWRDWSSGDVTTSGGPPSLQKFLEKEGYFSDRGYNFNPQEAQEYARILSGGSAPLSYQGTPSSIHPSLAPTTYGNIYKKAPWTPELQAQLNTIPTASKGRFSWDRLKPFAMMATAMARPAG